MGLEELAQWLMSLPLSRTVRRITWIIPLMQTIHILATAAVLSSVLMLDLRVWGAARSHTPVESAHRFTPWIWVATLVLTATGAVLILAGPRRTLLDGSFQLKMLLMAVAIPVTLALPIAVRNGTARGIAGFTAAVALVLWVAITLASRGRWMAGLLPR